MYPLGKWGSAPSESSIGGGWNTLLVPVQSTWLVGTTLQSRCQEPSCLAAWPHITASVLQGKVVGRHGFCHHLSFTTPLFTIPQRFSPTLLTLFSYNSSYDVVHRNIHIIIYSKKLRPNTISLENPLHTIKNPTTPNTLLPKPTHPTMSQNESDQDPQRKDWQKVSDRGEYSEYDRNLWNGTEPGGMWRNVTEGSRIWQNNLKVCDGTWRNRIETDREM